MRHLLLLAVIALCSTTMVFAQSKSIQVLDKNSRAPVINAHILNQDGKPITVTDLDGFFEIDTNRNTIIRIRSMGYQTKSIVLDETGENILLEPAVIHMNTELHISGKEDPRNGIHSYHNHKKERNMDQFLSNIDGVSMVQRGAFAWEPVIRGQADQRMNMTIDGMQVFKACVDKMDPITSYVETTNLSKLQIDKSGAGVAQNGNGNSSINLVTQKAEQTPLSLDMESSFRLPDYYQRYSITGNGSDPEQVHAVRLSATYKKADEMQAGNAQTIENTQFEKMNLNVNYRYNLPAGSSVELNYITDKAYDVGYPALLMDAAKALADIGSITYNFADSPAPVRLSSAMLYANSIRHSMEDYNRDVANRKVMRGMNMPMFGKTTTYGTKLEGHLKVGNSPLNWFIDAFTSEAFGDMEMLSIDPDIEDMLIYNLDEVRTNKIGIGVKHRLELAEHVLLSFEESVRFKSMKTTSASFASLFEGMYNRNIKSRNRFLIAGSANLLWLINDAWSITGSTVYSERMGNHMELFGHYVYNYTDGYFYDGNPWLKPERSINLDLNTTWKTDHHSLSLSVFGKQYFNYIDGIVAEDLSNSNFQFKKYINSGEAIMLGSELRTINNIRGGFRVENRLSYLHGQNQTLNDPLPLIPPLKGTSILSYSNNSTTLSVDMRWAARQHRISRISSNEDHTEGYAVLDTRIEQSIWQNQLQLSLEVSNITDRYYHTHTSIGNIPEAGINFMAGVKLNL
ncbi:MAG: TonB-dependent receptor [Balneolaceae bacterium]|nr:TonB-dependent receptor [Balneolaceae bacterium]